MSAHKFKRNIIPYSLDLFENYPAIAIIGARQTGKTTLAKQIAPNFTYFDFEKPSDYDRITHDPEFFFKQYATNVIFDEAQTFPGLFPLLRNIIDEKRQQKGRFIITGSSAPELLENISESLAGRIAVLELGTLKANERYNQPVSDFYQLFHQKLEKETFNIQTPPLTSTQIQNHWLFGGYPEPITYKSNLYQEWMIDYQKTYINRDIVQLFPKLNKINYRRFLSMLSKLSNKIINKSDLARSIAVSEPTIRQYLEIAHGTFIWRQLPSFKKNILKNTVKMPKGFIRDSGLLHHLLHINSIEGLLNSPDAGFSFEAFVIEEILKGLQDTKMRNIEAYFFRTRSGAEIDLILEGNFGLLPIEIKLGYSTPRRQLKSLTEFILTHQCPYGIVINQSDQIEWLTEHIVQIPVGYI